MGIDRVVAFGPFMCAVDGVEHHGRLIFLSLSTTRSDLRMSGMEITLNSA